MNELTDRITALDITLYNAVGSATSSGDRRSLLAVQRAAAGKHKEYVYLEIGSHLGGSIQSHLVDDRCKTIYSIDSRPFQARDDRAPGCFAYYEDNTSAKMLSLLGRIPHGDVTKIECFDMDASEVDKKRIKRKPQIVFIDGEHTTTAVLSDFRFCSEVLGNGGTILFHDFSIIYPALYSICKLLKTQHRNHISLKLEGEVFAIFFDQNIMLSDEYLADMYARNKHYLKKYVLKQAMKKTIKRLLPSRALRVIRTARYWAGM